MANVNGNGNGNLANMSLSVRDIVVGGVIVIPMIIAAAVTYNTIVSDVGALKRDVQEIRDHQKQTFRTLNRILTSLGVEPAADQDGDAPVIPAVKRK